MNLLHIDSSILGADSISRELTARIVNRFRSEMPGLNVSYRDLAANPLEHLQAAELATLTGGEDVTQFLAADVVVMGAPMYNFTISSQLKAWIDRVIVAGKTFVYTQTGAAGLAGGKRMIVAMTRGGMYAGDSPYAFAEHAQSYIQAIFGFIGVRDIEFIVAEGIRVSPEIREAAVTAAQSAAAGLHLDAATV